MKFLWAYYSFLVFQEQNVEDLNIRNWSLISQDQTLRDCRDGHTKLNTPPCCQRPEPVTVSLSFILLFLDFQLSQGN